MMVVVVVVVMMMISSKGQKICDMGHCLSLCPLPLSSSNRCSLF
jgi:hypothetical protein